MFSVNHVVITGASAGVGRATALQFAKQGTKVTLLARSEDALIEVQNEIAALGGEAIAIPTDVAFPEQVERAAAVAEDEFGPIDVWVNNAMVSVFSPVHEMTAEEYKRVTEVTYLGFVYGTLSALKRMRPRNRGVIVQVGSALAYRSIPLQSAYCAAKHAIMGFTASLRCELLHDRSQVQVTAVHLPALNTPQFDWVKSRLQNRPQPVPPIFQPEVAARAIWTATQKSRREWYVGFPTMKAIWANKIVPSLADHYLARFGYSSQQTDEPDNPNRENNLWVAPAKWHRTHGRFDQKAMVHSKQFWLTKNRRWLAAASLLVLFLGGALYS